MKKVLFTVALLLSLALPALAQQPKKKEKPRVVRILSKIGHGARIALGAVGDAFIIVYVKSERP